MRLKKILTLLLTLAMVVSLLPATAFAAGNTATTMRLAKTQGTVAVTNATGKKVKQTSNMKLYNGYKLKTGAKSYAWISLDNTKVAKLDANSVVSVQKTGQKLTLYLSSGNIFFNVKEKLSGGESFHIKTSTMTTGIRGTSGCVRVINPRVSEIHLLTGRIEVFAEHPELHLTKSEVLTAGTMATSLIDQEAMALTGEQVEIIVKELDEHTVCGNCATEVAEDPVLQERIEAETDLDVEEIVDNAEEKLAEDEQAAEEKAAEIEEAVENQVLPEDVDPYFEEEASSGGGGGGGSVAEPTNVITVTDWQKFVAALTEFNGGTVDTEIRLAADIEPDTGVTTMPEVEDNGASLTLNLQEYGLSIPQPLVNHGNLTITNVDGYITAYDFENWTTSKDIVQNYGTLTHLAGQIQMPGGYNGVYNQGTYTLNGGTFDRFAESDGDPTGAVQNSGTFRMQDGAVTWPVTNNGTATISGGTVSHVIVNNDTMTISGGAMTDNEGFNGNWIQNNGEMDITGGTFTYHGRTELMEGSISIASGAELNITGGTFTDEGVLIGNKGGTFSMTGGQMTVSSAFADRDIEAYYDAAGGTATIGGSATIIIDVSSAQTIVMEQLNAIQLAAADAELTMTGGTIEVNGLENENTVCGVRVTDGTFYMTSGTIIVNTCGTGVLNNDTAKLSGGTIAVRDTAKDAIAVSTSGELKTDGTVSISASGDNTGIYASNGTLELADGRIRANGEAIAVVLRESGTTIVPNVIRPIGASITWGGSAFSTKIYENGAVVEAFEGINFSGDGEDHLIQPMITMMDTLDPGPEKNVIATEDPETGRREETVDTIYEVYFMDMYGNEGSASGPVTNARDILTAIKQFNLGMDDSTLTLENDIEITLADIEAYGDSRIENTASTLTIDLAGNTLTLQNQLFVADRGSLKITDSGSGGMVTGTIVPLISGEGTFELEDGTLETTGANAVKSVGDVIISGGVINVTQPSATGVSIGSGGSLSMTGGAINQTTTATYSKAIVLSNGSTAEVTGGAINQSVGDSTGIMMGEEGGTAPELAFGGTARINVSDQGNGIVNNYGTVEMTGGTIQLNNVPSKGITSEEGTVEMTGGEIILVGSSNSSVNYGIYGNNTKITLDGGTVRESGDTTYSLNCAVYAGGGKLDLTSGAVSVNYGQGVYVSSTDIMALSGTTVTALEYEDLLVTGDNDETGYTYSEYDTTYFKLEKAVPNTVVNTWEQFVAAVNAFNGSSEAQIITLAESIDPTEEEVTAYSMPAGVGNGTSSDLTIDLGTYSLALPATLATSTSSGLVIKGTTGSITTGSQWDGSTYLINNYTDLTLAGGTIDVPHGVVGVNNTGSFDMDGGTMNVVYTTGIQNSGTVNLNAGKITMSAAGAPEGVTEETSIAYSAYMTNGTGAALNLKGTNITMTDGISYVYTDANGDDVDSPAVAVNNEAGNTVTMTAGTITVNSDLGISNKGTLNISGGTITVNADSGENVKGIENFGTFDLESGTMNVNGYGVGVLNGSAGTMNAEGGTINVKAARAVGIENIGATNLEGTMVEARNGYSGGIGVSNTGALTMTAGTIWTDLMPGVSMSAGTFNMTGGSFQSRTTGYGAVDLDGGTATLSGGSITVTGSNAKERGVQVSGDATLIIDGTAITATGYTTYNENNKTIAIYHQSGTVRIDSGTITAESEAFDANTGIGNAYALYSETSNWAGLDVAPGVGVVVRATTAANVINPAHTTYTVSTTAADGYYTLVVPE